jgi:hypothetical protein
LTPGCTSIDCVLPGKDPPVAAARRSKSKIKSRPKYKRERSLRGRKIKAKKNAAHKRGLNRSRARRAKRGAKKK